ncbi:DNA-processing protein DprA [Marinomonas flavescens]|uniref:DNA-processing protein DprA n=1 Tax=Marinomonas flavescens TaxID=2529379 RepID=UPI001054579F|nr:DNA-processing protein DprA [Marinomonas flavescens]
MTTSSRLIGGLSQENWLCLSFLTGIGPSRLSRLFTYFDQLDQSHEWDLFSDEQTVDDLPDTIVYELLRQLKWPEVTAREAMAYLDHGTLSEEQTQKKQVSLEWLEADAHHLLLQSNPAYPSDLKEIAVAPAFLYVDGDLTSFSYPKLGIVGARHCTGYGREATRQLASQLSHRGIAIVSGGARGIDTAAHQGALEAQSTPTIAVMGTGLLNHYPKQNKALFQDILSHGGCLVSEYPLMTDVRPHLFPPRNRIISGLSLGILVTEASPKSGSLISANYAVQQNRDVFALPGRVKDIQAEGCHQLIRQGAILVRHVEDILEEILPYSNEETGNNKKALMVKKKANVSRETSIKQPSSNKEVVESLIEEPKMNPLPLHLSASARAIVKVLEVEAQAMDFDSLIRHTQINAASMMQALMELELSQCIENKNGAYMRC